MNSDIPSNPSNPSPIASTPGPSDSLPLPQAPASAAPAASLSNPVRGTEAAGRSPDKSMPVRSVNLAIIRCDAETQSRSTISEEVAAEYAERMLAGDVFPPVDVFFDGATYYLADGFHRVLAASKAKLVNIACTLHPGNATQALWFAIGANRSNGLHRTKADKRHAIEVALRQFPGKTQQEIANQMGCNQSTVQRVQNQLMRMHKLTVPPTHQGKDTKSRPTKYAKRSKAPKVQPNTPAGPQAASHAKASAMNPRPSPLSGALCPPEQILISADFRASVKGKFRDWLQQWPRADIVSVLTVIWEITESPSEFYS